jgi:hypothetical protein
MSTDVPVTHPRPEDIALWLTIAHAERIARRMAVEEAPPSIDAVRLFSEGRPIDDPGYRHGVGDYIPAGKTVEVQVAGTNCAEVVIDVPGVRQPLRKLAPDPGKQTQTFTFEFAVSDSGPIRVWATNALGDGLDPKAPRPDVGLEVRALPRPSTTFVFGGLDSPTIDDAAIQHLADTWARHREYALDFDSAELSREQRALSEELRRVADDDAFATRSWAGRLRNLLSAHAAMSAAVTRAAVARPTLPAPIRVPSLPRLVHAPSPRATPGWPHRADDRTREPR